MAVSSFSLGGLLQQPYPSSSFLPIYSFHAGNLSRCDYVGKEPDVSPSRRIKAGLAGRERREYSKYVGEEPSVLWGRERLSTASYAGIIHRLVIVVNTEENVCLGLG